MSVRKTVSTRSSKILARRTNHSATRARGEAVMICQSAIYRLQVLLSWLQDEFWLTFGYIYVVMNISRSVFQPTSNSLGHSKYVEDGGILRSYGLCTRSTRDIEQNCSSVSLN